MPESYEHSDPFNDALRQLIEDVTGFLTPGDRMAAVVKTVKILRKRPDLAAVLLAEDDE